MDAICPSSCAEAAGLLCCLHLKAISWNCRQKSYWRYHPSWFHSLAYSCISCTSYPSPSLFFLLFVFLLPLLPLFPLSFSPSLLLLLLFPSVPPSFFLSSSLYPLFLLLFFLPSPPPSLLQDQYRKLFESCQQQYQGEGPTGILLIYPQHCVHLIEAPWRVLRDVIRNLQEMDSNG